MAWPRMIFVATTELGVYVTNDFSNPSVQPIWTAINAGLPALNCNEFDLDQFHQDYRQYVLLWDAFTLYRREGGGNWTSILTPTQCRTICGLPLGTVNEITSFCSDLSVDGRVWALYIHDNVMFAMQSDDYGDNWVAHGTIWSTFSFIWHIRSNGDNVFLSTYVGGGYLIDDYELYSTDLGANWTSVKMNQGSHFGYNPLVTDRIYTNADGDDLAENVAGVGRNTLQANIPPTRQDSLWFDYTVAAHHRLLFQGKLYVTTDTWANKSDGGAITYGPYSLAPWAGVDVDQMLVGLAIDAGNHHIIGTMYGEADTTPDRIAGNNPGTPPYTDSIPYSISNEIAQRGIQAVRNPPGVINTYAVAMPGYSDVGLDRGVPMAGDRSAWDAKNYPLRHTNDIDDAGIHWTEAGIRALGIPDHDHSGDVGDGGTFDAANLTSDAADDGDVLTADGIGGAAWEPGGGGALALDDLTDVNAPAPNDQDVLLWDDVAGEWISSPAPGGALALDDLTDVNAPAPNPNDVLVWDDVAGEWISAQPPNNMYIDQAGGTADTYGILGGARNGANTTFTVSQGAYNTGTLTVYLNGQLLTQGTAEDWVETDPATGTFDFDVPPEATDEITVVYGYMGYGGSSRRTATEYCLLRHSQYGVDSAVGAVFAWCGNALTANTAKAHFDKLLGAQIIYARFLATWTPNAPGVPTSGIRLIHCDDGPANIVEIIAYESNSMTPIVSATDITADLQALLAAGVYKHLGYQLHGDGTHKCTVYSAIVEVVWG